MLREQPFDTDTVTINVAEGPPSGPSLVLLHGGTMRWQALAPIIPDLAGGWHVYALDFRGHGASGWAPGHYRLRDYVADTAAFLTRRLSEPAILFGHSLGGTVALVVAAQYPQTVRAVVVEDTPISRDRLRERIARHRPMLAAMREVAGSGRSVDELAATLHGVPMALPGQATLATAGEVLGADSPWFKDMAETLRCHDPSELTALIDEFDATFAGWDAKAVLPGVACPVLLLQGDPAHGGLLTDDEVALALALLSQATHVQIEGVGHGPHRERPEAVVRAVVDFLNSL